MNLQEVTGHLEAARMLCESPRADVDSMRIALDHITGIAGTLLDRQAVMPLAERKCLRFTPRAVLDYERTCAPWWVRIWGRRILEAWVSRTVNRKYVQWLRSEGGSR